MKYWIAAIVYIFVLRLVFNKNLEKSKKNQLVFLILAVLPIFYLMAFRNPLCYTGDVHNYFIGFSKINSVSFENSFTIMDDRYETGYVLLNRFLGLFFKDGQCILFVVAFICLSSVVFFIYKNSNYPFMCLLAYFSFGLLNFQMTGFRQAIAMSICLFSYEFIKKRKIIPFIILVALAYEFHSTAIIFLFAYILYGIKANLINQLILLAIAVITGASIDKIMVLGNNFFGSDYGIHYIGSPTGGLFLIAIYILTFLLVFFYKKQDKVKNIFIFEAGILTYVMRYLSVIIERFTLYFTQTAFIIFPEVIQSEPNKKLRITEEFLYVGVTTSYFIYTLSSAPWAVFHSILHV